MESGRNDGSMNSGYNFFAFLIFTDAFAHFACSV